MHKPQAITGGNVIVLGYGHLGVTKGFTPPKVTRKMMENNNAGMVRELATGWEKMEASFTLSQFSPYIYMALASQAIGEVTIVHKANIVENGSNVLRVDVVKGTITEIDDGDIEAEKEVERKVSMSVTFYSCEVGGSQLMLLDTENLIAIVNGIDLMEDVRSNLQ